MIIKGDLLMKKANHLFIITVVTIMILTLAAGCKRTQPNSSADLSSNEQSLSDASNIVESTESTESNASDVSTESSDSNESASSSNVTNESTPVSSTSSAISTNSAVPTPAGGINLKGRKVEIHLGVYDAAVEATSSAGKYAIQQRKAIEKKYNCTLVVKQINYETFMPKLLMGDSSGADIIDFSGIAITPMVKNELLYPLDELIDFTQSHFDRESMKQYIYFGQNYGAIPKLYGIDNIGTQLVMWFNKRLVANAGYDPDSLYQMQKNKTWTWDKFKEIATKITKDTNSDNMPDIWGVGNGYRDNYLWMSLMISNGEDLIKKVDGKTVFNVGSAKSLEALNYWQQIAKNINTISDGTQDTNFIQGKIGFLPQYVNRLQFSNYKAMKDDFGILYFPKAPSASRYYSPISYVTGLSIPSSVLRNDDKNHTLGVALGAIINELSKPAVPTSEQSKLNQIVFESVVRDKGSLDVLKTLGDSSVRFPSKYYGAVDYSMVFNTAMQKVAIGSIDVNTAVRQNQDALTKLYLDSLPK